MEKLFAETNELMKLTGESKLLLGIVGATIAIIAIASVALTKPAPTFTKEELVGKAAHAKGSPKAKAYLVEFSDFQCPACKAAKPYVDDTVKTYGDKLYYVYRHFPLQQHEFGQKAAEAAEAASAQGKFWEIYDALFANQEKFSPTYFGELAKELKLDEKKFNDELSAGTYKNIVLDDAAAGNRFGVNSTPTFYLNGSKLNLTSFADVKTAVGEALK